MPSKHKQHEAPKADPANAAPVDIDDPVEVSSVDSFPASDPPGWITQRPRKAAAKKPAKARKPAGRVSRAKVKH